MSNQDVELLNTAISYLLINGRENTVILYLLATKEQNVCSS
jgi:hypothetical protein